MRALVILVALLSGCAHTSASKEFAEDFPRVTFPDTSPQAPEPGWCENTQPIGPGIDPDCVGMLVPPGRLRVVLDEADFFGQCKKALDLSYKGREADRAYAIETIEAREEQLRLAREMQPRLFALGAAAGGGSVAIAVILGLLSSR